MISFVTMRTHQAKKATDGYCWNNISAKTCQGHPLHVSTQVLGAKIHGMGHLRILAGLEQAQSIRRISFLPGECHKA